MPNALFICGSLNQTRIMHSISTQLAEVDCYFTPFYADGIVGLVSRLGWLDFSILGGQHRRSTQKYLIDQGLRMDYEGKSRSYDLVFTCTDLIIQRNILKSRLILVQEGITDPETWLYRLVRYLKLPRYLANTAATGLSDAYDLFCVASPGYRDLFIRKGVRREKIAVTGIPNFDDVNSYRNNPFPYSGYVLVTTTSLRETLKPDDRMGFLRKTRQLADGKPVIFKLHPNENFERAEREIRRIFPDAPIFRDGNTAHMVANCDLLVTQHSTVSLLGAALGKPVITDLDAGTLKRLAPIQNGGSSARRIAYLGRQLLQMPLVELRSAKGRRAIRRKLRLLDAV